MYNSDLTATGILSLLNTNKDQRKSFVAEVLNNMLAGKSDPLQVHLQVKSMEEICNAIKEDPQYKDMVLTEAAKYGKRFELTNAKIEVRASAGKYDFSNDAKWVELHKQLKAHETYLKGLPSEGVQRVTPDGEVVTDYPPSYAACADTVFITLK
jgi:hypothetical protein